MNHQKNTKSGEVDGEIMNAEKLKMGHKNAVKCAAWAKIGRN
jgi:hypothetical protein